MTVLLLLTAALGAAAFADAGARACLGGTAPRAERSVAAGLLAAALVSVTTRLLLLLQAFGAWPLALALLVIGAGARFAALRRGADRRGSVARPAAELPTGALPAVRAEPAVSRLATAPVFSAALCAVGAALAAAVLLPIWQWDALGYHLPFVNHAVKDGAIDPLVRAARYIGTYPHAVDLVYAAARALLGSDALLDAAQIPFGLLGAAATALTARRLGAAQRLAWAAGAGWLTLPAVVLLLPTNYVDVAAAALFLTAAAFALGPLDRGRLVLLAVALGLFLGAKPTAPPCVLLVAAAYLVRLRQAQGGPSRAAVAAAAALVLLLGAETYVGNVLWFGNPVWPVRIGLGPWTLPGTETIADLVGAGAAAPRPRGPLLIRIARSWFSFPGHLSFDTRLGGLGPLFWLGLAGAAAALFARRREGAATWALGLLLVAAVAQTEPSTPRFVLAFPALCLALAASACRPTPGRLERFAFGCAGVASLANVALAVPALTGEAPPLWRLARWPAADRILGLNPDGAARSWRDLRDGLTGFDVVAADDTFSLGYFLWREDLRNDVTPLPRIDDPSALVAFFRARAVTVLVAGDERPAGIFARRHPGRFERLFSCGAEPCSVYRVKL